MQNKRMRIPINSKKHIVNGLIGEWIELVDDVYLGANFKHNWKCKCGNEFKMKYSKISQYITYLGYYKCKKCIPARSKFENKRKEWTDEDIEYLKWAINIKNERLENICKWLEKSENSVIKKVEGLRRKNEIISRYKNDKCYCIECGVFKDSNQFYSDKNKITDINPLGKNQRCKDCEKEIYPERFCFKKEKEYFTKDELFGSTKVCTKCKCEKSIDEFGWAKKIDKKIHKMCNKCRNENQKKKIQENLLNRGY